jgi:hypothetical protein
MGTFNDAEIVLHLCKKLEIQITTTLEGVPDWAQNITLMAWRNALLTMAIESHVRLAEVEDMKKKEKVACEIDAILYHNYPLPNVPGKSRVQNEDDYRRRN